MATPADLTGLKRWHRAKDLGAGGASVDTWVDKSPVGRDAIASGGAAPTVATDATPNGGKAVQFSAAGHLDLGDVLGYSASIAYDASSSYPTEPPSNAFDLSPTTYWTTNAVVAAWLRVTLTAGRTATAYSIRRRDDIPSRNPTAWTLEGSDDGTSWTVLDTRSGISWGTVGETKTFNIASPATFRQYRINITANGGDGYTSIAELTLTYAEGPITRLAETWLVVKAETDASNGLWSWNSRALGNAHSFYPYQGQVYETFGVAAANSPAFSTSAYPIDQWRLYRVTNDGVDLKVYVDGALVATFAVSSMGGAEWGTSVVLGRTYFSTGASTAFTGKVAEIFTRDTISTAAEVADLITHVNTEHGLTVPGGSEPSHTGTVSAVAPSPAVSIAGVVPTIGQVAATAPAPVVNITGDVAGPTSGRVDATAPTPTVNVTGDVPLAVQGTVAATAPSPTLTVVDQAGTSASIPLGISVDVTDVRLLDVVVLPEVTIPLALGLDVTDTRPVVPIPGEVTIPLGMSLTARPEDTSGIDARTGLIPWRYIITDLHGNRLTELAEVTHGPVKDGINEPATMDLALTTDNPGRAFMQPIERQCLVMRGNQVLLRGPILPGRVSDNGATITHTIHDPSWYWRGGRRVIGRVPKKNLLYNGDFTHGLHGWTPGFDADSIPAAKPKVSIVDDDFTDGGKALQITGVESVTQTKSVLDSTAVYYPNRPFAWEPLAAGFKPGGAAKVDEVAKAMPTTAGLKVTIVGHTANDGTGNGLKLSLRRAEAAKARVLALRPNAIITTKGVGFYDPDPKYPIDSAQQRRVEISYESVETITGESRQWVKQTRTATQPKSARYELDFTAAAWLKVTDDWSVEDANMVTVKIVARRKDKPTVIWDEASTSISDTDPVDRWSHEHATVTIPPDGREYLIDVYLYAPAALARYTRAGLFPGEALYYWGTDQASIVKGLVEHMQDSSLGKQWPLVIGTRTPNTGVTRDRIYPHHERMPLETALDEWGTLHRGMDVDVLTTPTETTVATYYPRQGQVLDVALVQGRDITAATPATTSDVGSSIIAQAQDSGPARDEAYAEDARAFGGLRLERVITGEQETPINELDETALAELAWANASTIAWWVTIDPDRIDWVLANTSKGDSVRLQLEHPERVDTLARIVRREIHPTSLRLMLAKEA